MRKLYLIASVFAFGQFSEEINAQVPLNPAPTRVVGQLSVDITNVNPNLVEAKDLFNPNAVAVDATNNIMYVADSGNNRVLAWRNIATAASGSPADFVVGQRNFSTTLAAGPGTSFTTGLSTPTALAVDANGNLYVADGGNNRILRFPRPFSQPDDGRVPDMVFGQPNFNSRTENNGGVNANTLSLNRGGSILRSSLLLDATGNLWASDPGNNRVLMYPALALQQRQNQPSATIVIGQPAFTVNNTPIQGQATKTALSQPSAIAFDTLGRLYVCDRLNRVMVYTRPVTGASADRILGGFVLQQGQSQPAPINEFQYGAAPEGILFTGGTPFVVDTGNNRILRYDPFESWPNETTQFSPPARQSVGQSDFSSGKINRGAAEPSASGFSSPTQAIVALGNIFVVDSGNHRILAFPVQAGTISAAARVFGQSDFTYNSPNNPDGREMFTFGGVIGLQTGAQSSDGGGIAIDNTSNPPRLYVSDTYNNRILGYKDARNVRPGDRADIVIGQRDFSRTMINNPTNDSNQITDSGLFLPAGLAVDAAGNLYVADSGNGRVLRFQRPFEQATPIKPDLVLGQANFFLKITDASSRNMARPHSIAFTLDGHLLVSDLAHNRVLFFKKPSGGDFTNGQAADNVIGQPDFATSQGSNAPNRMFAPHGIATDTDDRLYVVDTGNNRLLIYDTIVIAEADPFPALSLPGFTSPHGIYVSPQTGEIWVANSGAGQALRFPAYIRLFLGDTISDFGIGGIRFPIAPTLDPGGNLYLVDGNNRVTMHYPTMRIVNSGHQLPRYAPYTHLTIRPVVGGRFAETSLNYKDLPDSSSMPTTLGDLQVLVNDTPAPIQSVSPDRIEIVSPQNSPTSGNVAIFIQRSSTGQIVAAGSASFAPTAPALFTTSEQGNGQVLAKNPDGKNNNATDRVGRGEVLSLFGTGFGVPSGSPADGEPTPDKVTGSGILRIALGTAFVPDANISYFGLAPGLVGIWQIDFKVPDSTAPEPAVQITCQFNSIPCNSVSGVIQRTTIAVKPSAAP